MLQLCMIERDGSRYAYRLTSKGFQVTLLSLFFHERLCGPLANNRFHHQPDTDHRPKANLKLPIIRLTAPFKTLPAHKHQSSSMLRHTAACKSSTNYVYDVGGKNLATAAGCRRSRSKCCDRMRNTSSSPAPRTSPINLPPQTLTGESLRTTRTQPLAIFYG